jgi:branched-chain amino acid transport system ATP-binding protein
VTTDIPSALEIESLKAGYGRFDVLHNLKMHIDAGESVALLGPNGAGKTTVLRSIMGLMKRRSGTVRVGGVDISKLPPHRIANAGYAAIVPEGRRLFVNQSVEDNLRIGGMRHRRDPKQVESLLAEVFDLFPAIARYRHRPASALSGGEQQMVAVGRMMMNQPNLMLLDEPSLGLAPIAIQSMAAALIRLRDHGHSILLVEQRVDLALQVCNRIYVLSDGRIVDEKETEAIDSDGRSLIDAYLG